MSDVFKHIKDNLTCVQYANQLGWPIHKSGDRTYSLDKGSNKSCLVVYDDFWHDFKTGQGGDVIDLCAIVNHGSDKASALKELSYLLNINQNNERYQSWKSYTQNMCNTIQKWHKQLEPEHYQYLNNRNITEETIKTLKIGFNNNRIIVPYFKNGYVSYWIGRAYTEQTPKYLKPKLDGLNENTIWGLHTITEDQTLIITEGVFDAVSCQQEGYNILSSMGGYFSKQQLKQLLSICKIKQEIILCFDSDNEGIKFALKLANILLTNRIKFSVSIPTNSKDINEYYIKNKNLNFIQDNKKTGIEFICQHTTDKDEFKKTIKQIARFISRTQLAEILDGAKEKFSKVWLAELKKQALSAPTEYYITEEIKKKYKLKYHPQLGFYEYQNGCWRKKEKEHIKEYIKKELGYYATGGKVNAICNLTSIDTVTTEMFNQKPVINFKNGLLLIDKGEFINHDPEYNTSIQLNYNYIPNLYSEKWLKFLNDITQENQEKINLIQEMFGYILFNDCSLQKCFILMGNGSDGKSKLLDMLKYMCGQENVTAIEMSCLTEPFQRIGLINSLVNIASETNTNVNQAVQIFKQIVTGDSINACYKGLDFVTFSSRAKMIMATNDFLNTNDISKGFDRRIIFIKFPVNFCASPIYDNELKADPYITNKLMPELPAIFNWAYDGYTRLKQNLEFSETDEQEEIKNEFRELNNPVFNFISELDLKIYALQEILSTNDLYEDYKSWCHRNGRHQLSLVNFSRKLKITMESYFKDKFSPYRNNTVRGYKIISPF